MAFGLGPEVELAVIHETSESVHLGLVDVECLGDGALADAVAIADLYFHAVVTGFAVIAVERHVRRVTLAVDDPDRIHALACELEIGGVRLLVYRDPGIVDICRCLGNSVDVDIIVVVFRA